MCHCTVNIKGTEVIFQHSTGILSAFDRSEHNTLSETVDTANFSKIRMTSRYLIGCFWFLYNHRCDEVICTWIQVIPGARHQSVIKKLLQVQLPAVALKRLVRVTIKHCEKQASVNTWKRGDNWVPYATDSARRHIEDVWKRLFKSRSTYVSCTNWVRFLFFPLNVAAPCMSHWIYL